MPTIATLVATVALIRARLAAWPGDVATMTVLVGHGASVDVQNRLGETVWHYAIRRDDDDLLRAVAALYRRAKRLDRRRTMSFAKGRSPLQVGHVYRYCQLHDDTFVGAAFSGN